MMMSGAPKVSAPIAKLTKFGGAPGKVSDSGDRKFLVFFPFFFSYTFQLLHIILLSSVLKTESSAIES